MAKKLAKQKSRALRTNALSAEEQLRRIRGAFYGFFEPRVEYWVRATYPETGLLIVEEYQYDSEQYSYFEVKFSDGDDGLTFAERGEWVEVEQSDEWLAVNQRERDEAETVVTGSLSVNVAETRREEINGRETLIVHGRIAQPVMNGTWFPAHVFQRDIGNLNDCAIVIRHPQDASGIYVAVRRDPDIPRIGRVFNAEVDSDGFPVCDFYFDVESAEQDDEGALTLEQAEDGEVIGVSIGVMLRTVEASGEIDGVPYSERATGFDGDHVAILPDELPACDTSTCGVNKFSSDEADESGMVTQLLNGLRRLFSAELEPEQPQQTGELMSKQPSEKQPTDISAVLAKLETMSADIATLKVSAEQATSAEKAQLVVNLAASDSVPFDESFLSDLSVEQLREFRNQYKAVNKDGAGGGGSHSETEEKWA